MREIVSKVMSQDAWLVRLALKELEALKREGDPRIWLLRGTAFAFQNKGSLAIASHERAYALGQTPFLEATYADTLLFFGDDTQQRLGLELVCGLIDRGNAPFGAWVSLSTYSLSTNTPEVALDICDMALENPDLEKYWLFFYMLKTVALSTLSEESLSRATALQALSLVMGEEVKSFAGLPNSAVAAVEKVGLDLAVGPVWCEKFTDLTNRFIDQESARVVFLAPRELADTLKAL